MVNANTPAPDPEVDDKNSGGNDLILLAVDNEISEAPRLSLKVIRKIDWHLIPPLGLLYLAAYIDRSALANASILGYKTDIQLKPNQYNIIVDVFYISYWLHGNPAQMLMPYFKPNVWLGMLAAGWGVVTVCNGLTQNFGGAIAARWFIGTFESGFFPGAIYTLSIWYPPQQLASRIACYYMIGVFAGSWGGLLAFAIAHMDGIAGLDGWRWLFILEGIATVVAAGILLLTVPNSPNNCRWLTAEEKEECNAFRKWHGTNTTDTSSFTRQYLFEAIKDVKTWMSATMISCANIAVFGFSYSLPTVLVQMGYKAENAQLMTIPFYAASALGTLGLSYLSDRLKMRGPIVLAGFGMTFVGLVTCFCLPKDRLSGVRYFFSMWILIGIYASFPSLLSLTANNASGPGKRNMVVSLALSTGNLLTIVGTSTYLENEAPKYQVGYGVGMGAMALAILVISTYMIMVRRENKRRSQLDTTGMSREELLTLGDKAPTFRYTL